MQCTYKCMCNRCFRLNIVSEGKQKLKHNLGVYLKLYSNSTQSVDKINQLDVTFCILYFSSNSCSTCFGQPCAHHQELTTA